MYEKALKQIGLTDSEVRVYLALLRKGPLTKTPIVEESKISGSKVYEVLNKLSSKGLVSVTVKNNVKHFDAASPVKIKEYIKRKKEEIVRSEEEVEQIIPRLLNIKKTKFLHPDISVFYGWEGFGTVYEEELSRAKKGTKVYVMGASSGKNRKRMERFFSKYGRLAVKRGLDVRVIFNTSDRSYVKNIERNIGKKYTKKFLFRKTPTEITVINDTSLITILHEEPTVIRIRNKETADSFKQYFTVLWECGEE
ncbi:MAG: TrmB family transcriptional regulator [Candidatus Heimdallarchaeaceae archaeon]